jgi:regulatory protein YycH of two-component signal transduction system YycFG
MILENIKTAILWVLIFSSIALTWLIWTYQPDYAELEDSGLGYVEIEDIGDSRSLSQMLQPKEVVIHKEEDIFLVHPGDYRYEELDELLESVDIDYMYPKETNNAPSLDNYYRGVEMVFDQAIKGEWLNELFSVEEDNIPIELVDSIVFLINPSSFGSEVLVQFIDFDNETMYESETSISDNQMEQFQKEVEQNQTSVEKRVFQERENSDFQPIRYVTKESIIRRKYTYESQDLSAEAFSDILFSDPEFVRHYGQSGQEKTYTDGNRMMTISENGSILKYERPDVRAGNTIGQAPILEDGLAFINGHSGWTNHYYADKWNESDLQDEVLFRLQVAGYPVLGSNMNDDQFHTIELKRTGNQITEFTRPMFQLEEDPFEIESDVMLPSFEIIEQHIEENELFNLDSVEDIRIGHNMVRQRSFATFEPSWYVKVRGRWIQLVIPADFDREVIKDGLE